MMDDYKVITAGSAQSLAYLVNKEMSDGWTPFGGVSVALAYDEDDREKTIYAQAMTWEDK